MCSERPGRFRMSTNGNQGLRTEMNVLYHGVPMPHYVPVMSQK